MTLQEVVDRNWQFFIREAGHPGVMEDGCVFRAPNGGRCAIGCVLPETMELLDGPVDDVLETDDEVADFFEGVPFEALEELADLHDEIAHHPYFHVRYRRRLRDFAEEWDLTIPDSYLLDDPDQLLLFDDAVLEPPSRVTLIDMKPVAASSPSVP
jgi:hypothetical protein